MIQDCFLVQHVDKPTRGNNILDLVLTSEEGMVSDLAVEEPLNTSDHSTVFFKLICADLKVDNCHSSDIFEYNFNRANYTKINKEISDTNWDSLFSDLGVADMWVRFLSTINDIIKNNVPKRKGVGKNSNNPWYSRKLKRLKKKKIRAWKKAEESKSLEDRDNYTICLNNYNTEVENAKRNYELSLAKDIKCNSKKFYSYVRGKSRTREVVGSLRDHAGNIISDNSQKCNILNEHFASVFNSGNYNTSPDLSDNEEVRHELKTVEITREIVQLKLEKLKINKTPGIDNISSTFLVNTAKEISLPVFKIFSKSLETSEIPEDWKTSNITPIFKSGDKQDPNNYRPVSLTSHLCKTFESIIKDCLVTYLDANNIISNNQHGFRSKHSCLTNLLTFIEFVQNCLDSCDPVDVIYLDFKKAFDRVPLNLLLHKLKLVGVGGNLWLWIQNWLIGRSQRVVIEGKCSQFTEVLSGVPQGSVLGPILFTVYINDLGDDIINKVLKFADDTKNFGKVTSILEVQSLQGDLDKALGWAEKWGMDFNINKCKVMHFGRKNLKSEYFLGGVRLQSVEHERDLGVIITDNMKAGSQCVKAAASGNKVLGLIKRVFASRSKEVILPLYKTIVRPHLEYCVQAWRPFLKKDIELLEKVQHRATKCISGMAGYSYEERLRLLKLPSLEYRRVRGDLIEVYKMYKGWSCLKFEEYFEFNNSNLRGHQAKIFKKRFLHNISKYSFSNRIIDIWNTMPPHMLSCQNINSFKVELDKYLRDDRGFI